IFTETTPSRQRKTIAGATHRGHPNFQVDHTQSSYQSRRLFGPGSPLRQYTAPISKWMLSERDTLACAVSSVIAKLWKETLMSGRRSNGERSEPGHGVCHGQWTHSKGSHSSITATSSSGVIHDSEKLRAGLRPRTQDLRGGSAIIQGARVPLCSHITVAKTCNKFVITSATGLALYLELFETVMFLSRFTNTCSCREFPPLHCMLQAPQPMPTPIRLVSI